MIEGLPTVTTSCDMVAFRVEFDVNSAERYNSRFIG